ncbi:MAG TPA: GAF domain-containing sensor histidine kinase [Anaerolineae bacterium]|nr:GAF domain-containing sensor histidine kinase [Anaerolineae bacterium]
MSDLNLTDLSPEELRQTLQRYHQELAIFQHIDQELNESLDLKPTLDKALTWARDLTGADSGSVGLLEEAGGMMVLRLLAYQGEAHEAERVVRADHPILAEVIKTVAVVHTNDVGAAEAIDGTAAASQLALPIRRQGKLIGMLTLEGKEKDLFQPADIRFAEKLADRAGVAIGNALLAEAIEVANHTRSEFISHVTHELRIPLTSIKGYADLMDRGLAGPLNDNQKNFVGVMRRNLERMATLLSDLSTINRLETSRDEVEQQTYALQSFLEERLDKFVDGFEAKEQSVTLDVTPEDAEIQLGKKFEEVIDNLVRNAHMYTGMGGEIGVSATVADDVVVFVVKDNGIGISEEEMPRIYESLYRGEHEVVRDSANTGWGLGLTVAKLRAESNGGTISCESARGSGSTFTVTVPYVPAEAEE